MNRKTLTAPLELKAEGNGIITGYASVFSNVDLGQDVVMPGAFKEFVTNKEGQVVVLYQHDTTQPIGTATVQQDEKGLRFRAQLVMEDPQAQRAYALAKAGALTGVSFGYDVLDGGAQFNNGVRMLSALKCYEISLVTFGMNELAQVEAVKAADGIETPRQFERFLRSSGFSRAESKRITAYGFGRDETTQDDEENAEQLAALAEAIKSIKL